MTTVKQLIDHLSQFNPDEKVLIFSEDDSCWKNLQLNNVQLIKEEEFVDIGDGEYRFSDYKKYGGRVQDNIKLTFIGLSS